MKQIPSYDDVRSDFEQFKAEREAALAQCLRGKLGEEETPDMPAIDSPENMKEQFYWFKLGINNPPIVDNIDWKGLEKELKTCAEEIAQEWHKRKRAEDRAEAFRSGRL